MNEPEIVPATEADLRDLARRRCDDEIGRRLYLRAAERAVNGAWIARDAGAPVGVAFARAFAFERFVSELFVEPSFRGSGIGRRLFEAATDDAADCAIAALADAADAATLGFLVRRGLALHVPVLRLAGEIPREDRLMRVAATRYRFATAAIDARTTYDVDALDREVRATAKPGEHADLFEVASGTAFYLDGECAGYAYVWPDGRIGPVAAGSASYLGSFLGFALAALRRTYGASWCTLLVPGSNQRVLRAAGELGLRVERSSAIFASNLPEVDLRRYVGFHPLSF